MMSSDSTSQISDELTSFPGFKYFYLKNHKHDPIQYSMYYRNVLLYNYAPQFRDKLKEKQRPYTGTENYSE